MSPNDFDLCLLGAAFAVVMIVLVIAALVDRPPRSWW